MCHIMQTDLSNIQTLSHFLSTTNHAFRVFDMGCRLSKLSAQQFSQFEQCHIPYPSPWLKHAWLGFLLWRPKQFSRQEKNTPTTPIVWFLKLPLDEQGMLIQTSRDAFLEQRLALIHAQMSGVPAVDIEAKLPASELAFTPDQESMAAFHAHSRIVLQQPASEYYQPVVDYFVDLSAIKNVQEGAQEKAPRWQHLGVQGFADLTMRLAKNKPLTAQVAQMVKHLPLPVLSSLAMQCENVPIPASLFRAFLARGQQATDYHEKIVCLRAISLAPNQPTRKVWLADLLQWPAGETATLELLATIASKCQGDLADGHAIDSAAIDGTGIDSTKIDSAKIDSTKIDSTKIDSTMVLFLNKCAEDTGVFNALVGELMYQPSFRQLILACVRQPQRSERLAKAFGQLLSVTY